MRHALLCTLLLACSPGTTPTTSMPVNAPSSTPPPTPAPSPSTFRLVVSFGSECCGTERVAEEALEEIIGRYPKSALGHTDSLWGKEGEHDGCFTLAGLSPEDQARFVAEVRAKVAGRLTTITENAACHPGR